MATQRLLRPTLRGLAPARPTDSMVQIISILGARRRESRAKVALRLQVLDALAAASEPRQIGLEERLGKLEGRLEQLERARLAETQRRELRRERIVRLREQLAMLRGPARPVAENTRVHRLGTTLIYVGGLAVLWVILLELGLALGLS